MYHSAPLPQDSILKYISSWTLLVSCSDLGILLRINCTPVRIVHTSLYLKYFPFSPISGCILQFYYLIPCTLSSIHFTRLNLAPHHIREPPWPNEESRPGHLGSAVPNLSDDHESVESLRQHARTFRNFCSNSCQCRLDFSRSRASSLRVTSPLSLQCV